MEQTETTENGSTTEKRFAGKTALITGGSSGIGFATASILLERGARVIITGRSKEKLSRAEQMLGGGDKVFAIAADAASTEETAFVMNEIQTRFQNLDILFANAGTGIFKPFMELSEEEFDQNVSVNFKGVFFTIQKALPLMNNGGAIIMNASWTPHYPMGSASLYSATKAAVANLARTLTAEFSARQIRVNSISPGYVNTDQFSEDQLPEGEADWRRNEVPLGRFGRADEIAKVVAFLASEDASYLTGQDILIDGGLARVKVESQLSEYFLSQDQ